MRHVVFKVLLILNLLILNMVIGHAASNSENLISEKNGLLVATAIIENQEISGKTEVARDKFVSYVLKAIGINTISVEKTSFYDVDASSEYAGYIEVAYKLGIVGGDGYGNFSPQSPVTLTQAVTIILKAMGYASFAEEKGGYPEGYRLMVAEVGLLKNINVDESYLTQDVMVELLYNSLYAKLAPNTSSNFVYEDSGTVLATVHKIFEVRGIITANQYTGLTGISNLGTDYIKINDSIYNTTVKNASDFLGYEIVAYVKEDDSTENKVIFLKGIETKNTVVTISNENILPQTSYSKSEIVANTDIGNSIFKISKVADVILNGKAFVGTISELEATLKPLSGNITLIDNNNDSVYEVVKITSYETLIVNSVSGRFTTVYAKFNQPEGPYLNYFNYGDYRKENIILLKDGKEIDFSNLKENNVLQFEFSQDRKIVKINVCTAIINGEIEEEDFQNGYLINNKAYKLNNRFIAALNVNDTFAIKPKLGLLGNFYLDLEGKIAFISENTHTVIENNLIIVKEFAYLKNAAMSAGVNEKLDFELFNQKGKRVICGATDGVILNGNTTKVKALLLALKVNGIIKQQIVQVRVSGDKLLEIDLADNSDKFDTLVSGSFSYNKDNIVFTSKDVAGKTFQPDKNTLMFFKPTDSTEQDDFLVGDISSLNASDYTITAYGYIEGKYFVQTNIVYIEGSKQNVYFDDFFTPLFVVSNVSSVAMVDDDVSNKVSGYYDGKMYSVTGLEKTNGIKVFDGVEKFDVIRIKMGTTTTAIDNLIKFTYKQAKEMAKSNQMGNLSNTPTSRLDWMANNDLLYFGRVDDISYSRKQLAMPYPGSSVSAPILDITERRVVNFDTTTKVYIMDCTSWKISLGSFEDIAIKDSVFARINAGAIVKDIIIYKNI